MTKKWIFVINAFLGIASALFALGFISFSFLRVSDIPFQATLETQRALPKNGFIQKKDAYDAIAKSFLQLQFAPLSIKVPDLKHLLLFFGKNARPDASNHATALHFALSDSKTQASIAPGERLYLFYDRSQTLSRYVFSPSNKETSLWLEVLDHKNNEAQLKVSVRNEKGEVVSEPFTNSQFTLPQKEFVRLTPSTWEIGKFRVDGTLLARQRVRWFGVDQFMENHGGDEFKEVLGKQRVDFGEGEETYFVYVGVNDCLVWDGERWIVTSPGKETQGKDLMQVKKLDERMLTFDLWDAEGKNKLTLNLLKSNEQWSPESLQSEFKFVASRTRSQFVFEINGERVLLKPQDWLVQTENGWKKLSTPEEIDDYVSRKISGPMFIFNGIVKNEDHQAISGILYSHNRTEIESVELHVPTANSGTKGVAADRTKKDVRKSSKNISNLTIDYHKE